MIDDNINKSENACVDLLRYIFSDSQNLFYKIESSTFIDPEKSEEAKKERLLYLLALAIYDIFSNNHEVFAQDNKVYDLGSFRGSAGFIADFLNNCYYDKTQKYNYMDFYMGTTWIEERVDLTSVYEYIFQKLKNSSCDWRYSFPRMYLIDLNEDFDNSVIIKIDEYNPENAVKEQIESAERQGEIQEMREELDKQYQEKYEEAKYKPLIPIVRAYKNIYGILPGGHPQSKIK